MYIVSTVQNTNYVTLYNSIFYKTIIMTALQQAVSLYIKVTVQFEIEGNGQNEIFSYMHRSEVKL